MLRHKVGVNHRSIGEEPHRASLNDCTIAEELFPLTKARQNSSPARGPFAGRYWSPPYIHKVYIRLGRSGDGATPSYTSSNCTSSFTASVGILELVERRDAHKQNRLLFVFPANLTCDGFNLPVSIPPPVVLDENLNHHAVFFQSPLPGPVTVRREQGEMWESISSQSPDGRLPIRRRVLCIDSVEYRLV